WEPRRAGARHRPARDRGEHGARLPGVRQRACHAGAVSALPPLRLVGLQRLSDPCRAASARPTPITRSHDPRNLPTYASGSRTLLSETRPDKAGQEVVYVLADVRLALGRQVSTRVAILAAAAAAGRARRYGS